MSQVQNLLNLIEREGLWDKEKTFVRNEHITTEGTVDTNTYFITEGSVRIYVVQEDEEHTIRFGYKNNLFSCVDSFITGRPTEFYVQALKKTHMKVLQKSSLQDLISRIPDSTEVWVEILEELVMQQLERERDLLISSPQARYQRVLERSPQLFQEIPNKYIADYLRMTPETLSRIKKS